MTSSTTRSHCAPIAALAILCPALALAASQMPPSAPVTVVNTTSNPVPVSIEPTDAPLAVSIVPASPEPTLMCSMDVVRSGGTPIVNGAVGTAGLSLLKCPSGVNGIRVRRVLFDPAGGSQPSQNNATFHILIGVNAGPVTDFPPATILLGMLTSGSPERAVDPPVELALSDTVTHITHRYSCTSGIAGFNAGCGGAIYLVGNPL